MIYFIDTNIFLRVLIREEEKSFHACFALVTAIKNGSVSALTSDLVLAEVSWTLASFYRFPRERVAQALESIVQLKNLKIAGKTDQLLAIQLYRQRAVKYIDAALAAYPELQQKRWEIVSYDKDFDKLGVQRREPQKIVEALEKRGGV